jgi:filamentous hemagglutinin family protein
MNRTYRSVRNDKSGQFALKGLAASLMLAFASNIYALPVGGVVSAGSASIAGGAGTVTVNQSSQNTAINWQSFSIGQTEAVRFVQPNSSAVALNRVLGPDPSSIFGSLTANGKVFLVNPGGILFGPGAQVNVGGLVASTRNIADGDFMAGNYRFAGTGGGAVVNQGSINAEGGYVALLGASVNNEGVITARLGTVALAAGNAFTLDVAGDGLLNVAVNQGAFDALAANGGVIRADGGQVLLSAMSAGTLLQSAVNNTGVIQAQTVENRNGTIRLLGDMQSGTVSVGGTLDASGTGAGQTGGNVTVTGRQVGLFDGQIDASGDAGGGSVLIGGGYQGNNPAVQNASATYMSADSAISADAITNGNGGTVVLWANDSTRAKGSITARGGAQGGDGGLIETSGHWLDVWGVNIDASAPNGKGGMWLLDPADVTISAAADSNGSIVGGVFAPTTGSATANVDSAALQGFLNAGTSVTITTTNIGVPGAGLGDITVNAALTWVPGLATSTLTLNAARDVNLNSAISATNGNLVVCCGRDVNVNAAITTVGGSILLGAGNDINMNAPVSATNGNITFCAGNDVNVNQTITLVNSGSIPAQGLGLPLGLVLSAGNGATGPGAAGGTVVMNPLFPAAVTRSAAPAVDITVDYNPSSYATPTNYAPNFTIVGAVTLNQRMLVFPDGATKVFDGTTAAVFTGLKGNPANVTLAGAGTANFDTAAVGLNKIVTFSGFSLAGTDAALFALPGTSICCAPAVQRTTGNITAAIVPPPPPPPLPLPDALPDVPPVVAALPIFQNTVGAVFARETGLDISVLDEGIRMPPVVVAKPAPVPPPPVVVPPAPPVYVPPVLPRRPDRN